MTDPSREARPTRRCERCSATVRRDFDALPPLARFGLGDGEPLLEERGGEA